MTATLGQLVGVRSQVAMGLLEYFQWVIEAPDRVETLPAYMGGRTRTELYIEPDVLERERKADAELPRFAREDGEAREESRAAEREPGPREHIAPEAQDIGEEALYGEREGETERRVTWAEEREELRRSSHSRAVVLGPPGQGKSLLAQMTAHDLAREAHEALSTQQSGLESLPLPIVVTFNALAEQTIPAGATPGQALRRALAGVLRETGCPRIAANYLAGHAHDRRSWLFLDALDEAGDDEALTRIFAALEKWQSRVIIASRPYGYAGQRLPFDVIESRHGRLDEEEEAARRGAPPPRPEPLDELEPKLEMAVLLGDPRSGKTEWLKYRTRLAAREAREKLENFEGGLDQVVFPVSLRPGGPPRARPCRGPGHLPPANRGCGPRHERRRGSWPKR